MEYYSNFFIQWYGVEAFSTALALTGARVISCVIGKRSCEFDLFDQIRTKSIVTDHGRPNY